MTIACPKCSVAMPDDAAYCPGCGRSMQAVERVRGVVGMLPRNLAGILAYCTFIPALVFLLVDPYRRDRFTRFHSMQCLALWVAALVVGTGLELGTLILSIVPWVGHLLALLIALVMGMAFFVIWLLLVLKAAQGEYFKLPLLGDFAERQAGAA